MVTVRVRCERCEECVDCPADELLLMVCTEDDSLNQLGYTCPECGSGLRPMKRVDQFYRLQLAGVRVSYFSFADLRLEQATVLREFAASLDARLEAILSGAA